MDEPGSNTIKASMIEFAKRKPMPRQWRTENSINKLKDDKGWLVYKEAAIVIYTWQMIWVIYPFYP